MDNKIYVSVLAATATVMMCWFCAQLAAPIAKPLAWALIIGIATLPHHDRMSRKFPGSPNLTAALMVLVITVCFIIPAAAVIAMVAQNAGDWYLEGERLVVAFRATGAATLTHVPLVHKLLAMGDRLGIDVAGLGTTLADAGSGYLISVTSHAARNIGELLFTLVVTLFALFYLYRDGRRVLAATINRVAGNRDIVHRYCREIGATITAVTVGTIFTCIAQGATACLGYYVAGVPAPVLCGVLTAAAAIIPVVGTGIVWAPLVILVAVNGTYLKAVLLALWCIVFVGLADNAIRPLAIGIKSSIPVPAIVLGALCGVLALGVLGLIVGPVLFAIIITIWRDFVRIPPETLQP
jgi:predicted PurR-regulated permease PerM